MGTQKSDSSGGSRKAADERKAAPPKETAVEPPVRREEPELFPQESSPHFLGTGSYRTGGSNAEGGGYGLGDMNPHGGYGTFTDAGGSGSTELYGEAEEEESRAAPESKGPGEDPQKSPKPPK